jgi:hypothetical protein
MSLGQILTMMAAMHSMPNTTQPRWLSNSNQVLQEPPQALALPHHHHLLKRLHHLLLDLHELAGTMLFLLRHLFEKDKWIGMESANRETWQNFVKGVCVIRIAFMEYSELGMG